MVLRELDLDDMDSLKVPLFVSLVRNESIYLLFLCLSPLINQTRFDLNFNLSLRDEKTYD